MNLYDPEFCQCGSEITMTNRPQKYAQEFHVEEGVEKVSYVITACNNCMNMPPSLVNDNQDTNHKRGIK